MAAALPGMDSTPEKSKEDSILAFSPVAFLFSRRLAALFGQAGRPDPLAGWGGGPCRGFAEVCGARPWASAEDPAHGLYRNCF